MDLDVFALCKKYTDETVVGGGAIKGKNCVIESINPIEGGTRITYQWTLDNGTVKYDFMDVMDGEDGVGITSVEGDGNDLVITLSNGTVVRIPIPSSGALSSLDDVELNSLEDGQILKYDAATGKWVNAAGSTGGGSLESPLTTSVTVGGIASGTSYPTDTPIETILRNMLNPVAYPKLTNPSATLSATGAKLLEVGSTLNVTFTLAFNRGSINPSYGTSGFRAGAATTFTLDGVTKNTNTFTINVTQAKTSYQGTVTYGAGEQPKDSVGNNYDSPLPAGSVNSNAVTYEFVNALYSNQSNIVSVTKEPLVSKSAKQKEFTFPAQTIANPEEFHVPADWIITAIEVLNTLSNQWESCANEFTISNTTHTDAAGNTVNYKRYVDNRGYKAGSRKIKIRWS